MHTIHKAMRNTHGIIPVRRMEQSFGARWREKEKVSSSKKTMFFLTLRATAKLIQGVR